MQVLNVLHAARWKCRTQKIRHLGTIAQLCRAISLQLRHVSTIGKKLVKQQCLSHTSLQYDEPRPTSGWDLLASLGHPSKFQRVSRVGSVTAQHSSSRCQPNSAALKRGRHLYLAGRPLRWPLAHNFSFVYINVSECTNVYTWSIKLCYHGHFPVIETSLQTAPSICHSCACP